MPPGFKLQGRSLLQTGLLVDRAPGAILYRGPGQDYSTRRFLADACFVAGRLPDAAILVNACQDRYRFAVLFAACVVAGRTCLLTGDHSERAIDRVRLRFAGCESLGDEILDLPAPETMADWPPPEIPFSQRVAIVLTSGSTGEPAAVPKLWGELVVRSRAAASRFGLADEGAPALVGTIPPHHMYGFETTVLLPMHSGSASWCGPVFYPADIRAALQGVAGPRVLVTTPIHLRAMLEHALDRPPEQVISATAPLDMVLANRAEALWGAPVLEIFGATELGSIASRRTVTDDAWILYPGLTLSPGIDPLVEAPYAPATRLSDRIERLDDGRGFRLLGRSTDLVKLGGRRASLSGLTRILNRLDGVVDGVFLAPDDLDRRPSARLIAVAVAPGRDAQSLLDALRREIDPIFLPRRLILCEALPRNTTGKLPRQALLDLVGVPDA